jgi:hypothetical protein
MNNEVYTMSYEEFFGNFEGYLRILEDKTCEGKGCYHLDVILLSLDLGVCSENSLCRFVFDTVDLESENIKVFEGVYLDI